MFGKDRINLLLISSFFLILFLVGCDPSSNDKMELYNSTKSIDLSDENIKSIFINSTQDKITDVFGKPNFIEWIKQPKSSYYIFGENDKNYDVDFRLFNGKVTRYFISSDKYATNKGISKGDSKDEVIKAYGKNYYERIDTGSNIIGYLDKVKKISIEFGLNNNKVNGIIVSETK
ncbi:hypothetical protein [Neobacillus endophyticus]|uniref:hypothetical protein n=1 Tax=Neobacillus endophyticus TaxID=2738405 RepID=UPI0028B25923|nr:hypothetical protein [Neobacillus endophyticus]